jgi:hypothetical protein
MTNATTLRHKALSGDGENLQSRIAYTQSEREGVHAEKRRLHHRLKSSNDWDGTAANDNIAWPLATALIREGNTELLKAAMYYRKVHGTAKSDAMLGGTSVSVGGDVAIDQRQWVKPNGQVAYKGVRVVSSDEPETTARRKAQTCSDAPEKAEAGYTNVPKAWKGDEPVNNMIDAKAQLAAMQSMLGPLVEPLEMAVIDGATYQAVGNASGVADRSGASAAGRAIVHMALVSMRDIIGKVSRHDMA